MTPKLKDLLGSFGLLYASIEALQRERRATDHATYADYYASLGKTEPDEPVLLVRISKDGASRFIHEAREMLPVELREQYNGANVTVMELPEEEYYFFQAFGPATFAVQSRLPAFLLQMTFGHAYGLFENYLADVVRARLLASPEQVGLKKQVTLAEVLQANTKEELVATMVEAEARRIMFLPIRAILDHLRTQLGLRNLPSNYDEEVEVISLTRNCLIHNSARVDSKLASSGTALELGDQIDVTRESLVSALSTLRGLSLAVDRSFESTLSGDEA